MAKQSKGKGNNYGRTKNSQADNGFTSRGKDWDDIKGSKRDGGVYPQRSNRDGDSSGCNTRRDTQSKGTNHIEWYVPDAHMLESVASLPFAYRTGDTIKYAPGSISSEYTEHGYKLPGIVTVAYTPSIGVANTPNDQVNVASTAVYSFIRKANSGARNYDHSDLMIYMLAMDSIYSGISWLIRARGIAQTYNRMNRYIPGMLLTSMGINANEMIRNLTSYTDQINTLIMKATTLAVPSTFPMFVRHSYMNTNIYTDLGNDRAQMYYFTPTYLHKFTLDEEGRGKLLATSFSNYPLMLSNFQAYINTVSSLIDAIYGDEDAGIMSGDIIKAYGNNLVKLNTIPNDYAITPIYDEEMLQQIHNATPVGVNHVAKTLDITQGTWESDTGLAPVLKFAPKYLFDSSARQVDVTGGDKIFDLHSNTTPDQVMRSSRLMITGTFDTDAGEFILDSCGSEIVNAVTIFCDPSDHSDRVGYAGVLWLTSSSFTASLKLIAKAQDISYFPMMYAYVPSDNDDPAEVHVIGNTDKVTVIKKANIEQLHNVALLGLFNVPRLTIT